MHEDRLKKAVFELPRNPGVYIYRNADGRVIYVGKAKNLKSRVSSYFGEGIKLGSKTSALVSQIAFLEHVEVQSEFEALLLEAELIKRYRPKYNIVLKDDKSYIFIVVKNEKIDGENLPIISTSRKKDSNRVAYFGPFPDGSTVNDVLRSLRKIIPFRDCSITKFKKYKKLNSPCLYGHIGLCSAPCVNKIKPEEYRVDIRYIKRLLSGDAKGVLNKFETLMKNASKNKDFESALKYRDILRKYVYITQSFNGANSYLDNPNLVDDIRDEALSDLKNTIPSLVRSPNRIECYDISNVSGKSATASMVVSLGGRLAKREYRRFRIRSKNTPDDFSMMKEVIQRRFKNHDGWGIPDLLVVDGGKGQVSSALSVMTDYGIAVPVIGLAKRLETIVLSENGVFREINLPRVNEGLKHLELLRDEAHRFARKYHHLLRIKSLKD